MRIVVQGLWHLGSVTAACLAEAGFNVIGLDPDAGVVGRLREGQPPLHEPGLPELVRKGTAAGRLSFTADASSVAEAGLVWVAFDTPVDDEDRADAGYVERQIETLFPLLRDGAVVLISSQLPVGSTRRLAARFSTVANGRKIAFAYSPENLRLGKAIEVFDHPERLIVGTEGRQPHPVLAEVLGRFSDRLVWMSLESAEMVKHALNAFLATSVTFINEIASIAEKVGAQASDVEEGLKSEGRIGRKAYLKPGAAFAGGTLARDVVFLGGLADQHAVVTPLLGSIMASNAAHRQWPMRRVSERFGGHIAGCTVAVLGLSYKVGTDALRRSASVALCRDLAAMDARIRAYDPVFKVLPPELAVIVDLRPTLEDALTGVDAAVVATECFFFFSVSTEIYSKVMRNPFVVDQNGFLSALLERRDDVDYVALGRVR